MTESKRTCLYDAHVGMKARMVEFAGWSMPIAYGSQIDEHHCVRRHAGMFDVSHMTIVDVKGREAAGFLSHVLANDVAKLATLGTSDRFGALYSCMLHADGGIIDDLIVYRCSQRDFRLVLNAATRDKDLAWLGQHAAAFGVGLTERDDLAMIAVQGPAAVPEVARLAPGGAALATLRPFTAMEREGWFIARTGYTGEDGVEILLPAPAALRLWRDLAAQGVAPCGLGARDTLRLEAGMNLYGQDMDESVSPLECGLAWTVSLDAGREFIGREALERQRVHGVVRAQTGLLLLGRGVMRAGHEVVTAAGRGRVTSGGFGPTLGRSIALARLPAGAQDRCEVIIRDRRQPAKIVKPPFVRNGEIKIPLD